MPIILDGTAGIDNNATDLSYTGTLTGGTGVVNLGSGQLVKDANGNVGIGTSSPSQKLDVAGTLNATEYRKNTVVINSIIFQDITISGLTTSFQTFLLSLPSGVSFTSVVTITPVNGVNDILYISEIALGEWSGVQETTQVRLTARLGNAVASNQGTARVYYRI